MVVLAIGITSKGGKPLVSRQFRPLPKSRIDGLLASFPKLIPAGSQHTTVENSDVRFVYQPFDEVYVLVMTNKGSNILQDMSTLSLAVRLITSLLPAMSEPAVLANSFELLCAFDEVVSLGYKENASLQQIRNVLEGESHEEKIQEIIARNKEAEAKEELKRRAKQLEMQRREQQRFSQSGGGRLNLSASTGESSNFSSAAGSGVYAPVSSRTDPVALERGVSRSQSPAISNKPTFKGNGMKLGKKVKQADFLNEIGRETEAESAVPASSAQHLPAMPKIEKEDSFARPHISLPDVHITIRETFSLRLSRDGEVDSFDAKGDMDLRINNPLYGKVRLQIGSLDQKYTLPDCNLQLQQHPNVAKFTASSIDKIIQLRDANRSFPIGQGLGVLRWRLSTKNESVVPLLITCWTTEISDSTFTVNLEFALNRLELELNDIFINVPLQQDSVGDVSLSEGEWSIAEGALQWQITNISNAHPGGNIEFTCQAGHADDFFPIDVKFNASTSVCGIMVRDVMNSQLAKAESVCVNVKVENILATSNDQPVPARIDISSSAITYSVI